MSLKTVRIVSKTRLIASIAVLLSLIALGVFGLTKLLKHDRNDGQTAANTAAATDYAPVDVQLSSEPGETQAVQSPQNTAETAASQQPTPDPTQVPAATASPTATSAPASAAPSPTGSGDGYVPIYSTSGKIVSYGNTGVFRIDNSGYEGCGYVNEAAALYTGLINKLADSLAGRTQVYSMMIPTSYGVTMPDDIRPKVQYYIDQQSCIEDAYGMLSSRVKRVNCFDSLMRHRTEYVYFRTDHHWTGRGAYYAYECFCNAKGVAPYTLAQRQEAAYSGFTGTFYSASGGDSALLTDTVYAYLPMSSSATMRFYESNGTAVDWPIVQNVTSYKASAKYAAFAGGDHGLTEFTNPEVQSGVLIVIKDSYGNALLPLLVDHYSKIYEIDYRYWSGSLAQLAIEKGATDMLFANNFHNISNRSAIAKLAAIAGV